jgi:4-hydroxybenzoate polyprenyltransferase
LVTAPILLGAALAISTFLPPDFRLALVTYSVLSVAYCLLLKRLALIDAITLAGLYTLRIVAGTVAVDVPLSFWLLLFSLFLFASLAFVKRFTELDALRRRQHSQATGRGYEVSDLPILRNLGCAAGYLSVLVLSLYINSPDIEALYRNPKAIWVLCILVLYWISRVWLEAGRGTISEDPVVYALSDRASLLVGFLAVIVVAIAI